MTSPLQIMPRLTSPARNGSRGASEPGSELWVTDVDGVVVDGPAFAVMSEGGFEAMVSVAADGG